MKNKLMLTLASLVMLIVISMSTGCVSTLTPTGRIRHQRRHVWVNEVYYEQVYYIDQSHNTVIVSQKEIPKKQHKQNKHDNDNDNKHNNKRHNNRH